MGPDVCKEIAYRVPQAIPVGENPDYVCTPGRETKYANSIGKSFCYIGQCVEQSLETHRLIPGRSPFIENEQAYPWDACMREDPKFASFATPPPQSISWFPAYRPALLVKQLDTELCQINGLPPRTDTFMCGFDVRRRLQIPLSQLASTALDILNQGGEYKAPSKGILGISQGLGARVGTTLYTNYLTDAARIFGETMSIAVDTLDRLTKIKFTPEMCPRNASESLSMMTHYEICVPH
jgi:hypothetical protein